MKATSLVPRENLNEYLPFDGITSIVQPWLEWEQVTDRTKQRYIKRKEDIVPSVLRTISPKDAGSLWQAIVSSSVMKKALDLEELSQLSKDNLEAFAEALAMQMAVARENIFCRSWLVLAATRPSQCSCQACRDNTIS